MKKNLFYPILAVAVIATATTPIAVVRAENSPTVSSSASENYKTLSKNLDDLAKKAKENVKKSTAPKDDKDNINTKIDSLQERWQKELKDDSTFSENANEYLNRDFTSGKKEIEDEALRAKLIGEITDSYDQVVKDADAQNISHDELDETLQGYFKEIRNTGNFKGYADYAKKTLKTFKSQNFPNDTSDSKKSNKSSQSSGTSDTTNTSKTSKSDQTVSSSASETQTDATSNNTESEVPTEASNDSFDFNKLVGTWKNGEGRTIIINADGTYSGDETGEIATTATRYDDTDIWSVGIQANNSMVSGLVFYAPAGVAYPGTDASDTSKDRFMLTNAYPEGRAETTYYRVATDTKSTDTVNSNDDTTEKSSGKIDGVKKDSTTMSQNNDKIGAVQTTQSKAATQKEKSNKNIFGLPSTGDSKSILSLIGIVILVIVLAIGYKLKKRK